MQKEKRDWPSIVSIVLSVVLALTTIGASWGAARAESSSTKDTIEQVQQDLKAAKDELQLLKTDRAVTQIIVQNIFEKLEAIDKHLDTIDGKIDKLKEDKKRGGTQEAKP